MLLALPKTRPNTFIQLLVLTNNIQTFKRFDSNWKILLLSLDIFYYVKLHFILVFYLICQKYLDESADVCIPDAPLPLASTTVSILVPHHPSKVLTQFMDDPLFQFPYLKSYVKPCFSLPPFIASGPEVNENLRIFWNMD